ncbi:Restriction modification system DNA specificity domain protein [Pseudomonas syringae pv. pisi]|nr:restriction endonuclease subunit S [Pseudomonas syringae]RMM27878.1 Restriction modification system DNA specificity domain protein [Pseudomonas syringae pv. pisi]
MSFDLPTLPAHWSYVPLGQLAQKNSVTYGVVQPGTHFLEGVPIVRVNNFSDGRIECSDLMCIDPAIDAKYSRTRLKGGEVLLTLVGSVGQVAVASKKLKGFNVARAVAVIHPIDSVEAEWIALCLRSPLSKHLLGSRANTTVQTTINLKDLRELPIPFPPESERKEITAALGALDSCIAVLHETNATLQSIAQTIFKSWFVDFNPVHAKSESRAPSYIDTGTADLFPNDFESSAVGQVPKGWKFGILGDIAQTVTRKATVSEFNDQLNYVGLEHIPRKSLSLINWGCADGLASSKSVFSKTDILFGKLRPYFHKVVIAPIDGVCSTDVLVCQPKVNDYYGIVLMHLFSESLISYANRLSNGAKMPRVSWKDLAAYPMCIPPSDIAMSFNSVILPMVGEIISNIEQIQTVIQLRETLLPKLISGEVRLQEGETIVDGAVYA